MKVLSFDTCLDKTYVTLFDGEKFHNKTILSAGENYHSAFLISAIIEILKENNMTPSDIDCIATDIGPGSFTGIRACTTVARMLAQQLNIGLIGVSSLEILSKVLGKNDLVALDARKEKAYFYDNEIKGAVDLETVKPLVSNKVFVTDNSLLKKLGNAADKAVSYEQNNFQLGEILTKIALDKINGGADLNWGSLKPLYIQPPPVFGK